jgi:WXG100 family type VII secretion target
MAAAGVGFRVLAHDVEAAAADCDVTASELQEQLAALKSYVVSLEGQWLGIASQTFAQLMADYDRYSAMLNHALTDIGTGLRGNSHNYVDAETSNVGNLTAMHNTIPNGVGFH